MLSPLSIGRVLESLAPAAKTNLGLRYDAVTWLIAVGEGIEAEGYRTHRE